jgi:hypothetical protein
MKQRRVVCAALRAADGTLVIGIRHYSADMLAQIHNMASDGTKFHHRHGKDQGFVDQHGVYMDRHEAYQVAKAANQIVYPDACTQHESGFELYSEGLY